MRKLFCQIIVNLYLTSSYVQSAVAFGHKVQEIIFHIFKELPLNLKYTKSIYEDKIKKLRHKKFALYPFVLNFKEIPERSQQHKTFDL